MIPGRSVWLYSCEEREKEGGGGGEGEKGRVVPWGLNRNHTRIITHLNGAIVIRKPQNSGFGGNVFSDLKGNMD